jgi:hypothetical protein
MAIAAEPLLPSGPPLAADWAAVSIAAALETKVTAATVVAAAAIAISVTNNDNHLCDGGFVGLRILGGRWSFDGAAN